MKKSFLILSVLIHCTLFAGGVEWRVGPHFQFTRLNFDQPQAIEGYMAGIAVEAKKPFRYFEAGARYQGSWDTNFFRGDPAQKSSIAEHQVGLLLGVRNLSCGYFQMTPYTGLGWHRLSNKQYPDTIGLRYLYDKIFVPVGIKLSTYLCSCMKTSILFEWRPDVYSKLHVNRHQIDNKYEHGFHIEIPFELKGSTFCSCYCLTLAPYFDWAQFGASKERNPNQVLLNVPSTRRWSTGLSVYATCTF